MDYVPVKESVHQWEQYFADLSEGNKSSNINSFPLEPEQIVEGIPANVLNQDGELLAPKAAGNVTAPREEKIDLPPAYKAVNAAGTSKANEDNMARHGKRKRKSKPRLKRVRRRVFRPKKSKKGKKGSKSKRK